MAYKKFIPNAKRRKLRADPLYQIITDDICDVFGASEEDRKKFQDLANGVHKKQSEVPA